MLWQKCCLAFQSHPRVTYIVAIGFVGCRPLGERTRGKGSDKDDTNSSSHLRSDPLNKGSQTLERKFHLGKMCHWKHPRDRKSCSNVPATRGPRTFSLLGRPNKATVFVSQKRSIFTDSALCILLKKQHLMCWNEM